MTSQAPALEMRGITKSFAGNVVLAGVSLAARAGEVHALVGENGAGKSTLMKILAGVHQPDAGEILIDGETRVFAPPGGRAHPRRCDDLPGIVAGAASDRGRKHLLGREPMKLAPIGLINNSELQRRARRCSTTSVSRSTRGRAWGG